MNITLILPFIRPSVAEIKDLKGCRMRQKLLSVDLNGIVSLRQELGFLNECKKTMRSLLENKDDLKFNGKSMYL
jgi:hypothetical protein